MWRLMCIQENQMKGKLFSLSKTWESWSLRRTWFLSWGKKGAGWICLVYSWFLTWIIYVVYYVNDLLTPLWVEHWYSPNTIFLDYTEKSETSIISRIESCCCFCCYEEPRNHLGMGTLTSFTNTTVSTRALNPEQFLILGFRSWGWAWRHLHCIHFAQRVLERISRKAHIPKSQY